MPLTEYELRI
ncbi:hypothetical protein YPPY54_2785, partial [Yersinia pestis PY-54]